MTLAGFMRGGGGSTNMRLSRRHCWLASRVAQQQQQQRQTILLLLLVVEHGGWGGGCTQGSITLPPFATRPLSQLD